MKEAFFTGYCASLNGARTVMTEEGEGADCDYPDCPFAGECPIAKKLETFLKECIEG